MTMKYEVYSHDEAVDIISHLKKVIAHDGYVTAENFYNYVNLLPDYEDSIKGWTDLSSVRIESVDEIDGPIWRIVFPPETNIHKLEAIKDSGERSEFDSGAVRDMHEGKGRFDLLPMCVLIRLAKHYENGAKKYEERNWEKGIPAHSFADSAMRHLVKYMDGWDDEDHLIAAIWNLCGLAWTEEKKPELIDIPSRQRE